MDHEACHLEIYKDDLSSSKSVLQDVVSDSFKNLFSRLIGGSHLRFLKQLKGHRSVEGHEPSGFTLNKLSERTQRL